MKPLLTLLLLLVSCASVPRFKAPPTAVLADTTRTPCSSCAEWNVPHAPVRIFGNTYYVGTNGLSAILVTSPEGHMLIDGALKESAPLIRSNIEALGFRVADIKLILNSHAHFDHAGGIAALQHASGATVAASPASAAVLRAGRPGTDDPQYAELIPLPMRPVPTVREIADGETLRAGPLSLTAHFTPGHTAGGTTWTWTSCEGDSCRRIGYADSLTPVSEAGYRFSQSDRYPSILDDFAHSYAVIESLPCDILLTPHPGASRLFERLTARAQGDPNALIDPSACARYAVEARQKLAQRLASEK